MIRDPLYRDIESRLAGRIDPELFERCAANLLRRASYPTLVPVRGGADSGMDGALGRVARESIPLVTTTSPRVRENLRRSLNSYIASGRSGRDVLFATSRVLSPAKRRGLEAEANECGFRLLNIHDGAAFADLLYRDPEWCRELLNLDGTPPPLSVFPPSVGNHPLGRAIGRDDAYAWLTQLEGDGVLIGQPGIGKSCLLHSIALDGHALFIASDNIEFIASGIRAQQPERIILDDAHDRLSILGQLLRMRREMGSTFRLVASTWPLERDAVTEQLTLPETAVFELGLLPRDVVLAILRDVGLHGPNRLLSEILEQAAGRPGLAVTLAQICLQGGAADVAFGTALARNTRATFLRLLGPETIPLLAALAVGGRAGMVHTDVTRALGLAPIAATRLISGISTGGVVLPLEGGRLTVHPEALRWSLVKDTFFRVPALLQLDEFIGLAPEPSEMISTLVGARGTGGAVPHQLLRDLLGQFGTDSNWREYASLGTDESRWVLATVPERIVQVAHSVLAHVPELAIPRLLSMAVGDTRSEQADSGNALRLLKTWIDTAPLGSSTPVARRRALFDAARDWFDNTGDSSVASRAFGLALAPDYSFAEQLPGSGRSVRLVRGLLRAEDLGHVAALWSDVAALLSRIEDARPILRAIEQWLFPGRVTSTAGTPLRRQMRRIGCRMVRDVAAAHAGRQTSLRWAEQLRRQLRMRGRIGVDAAFLALYPIRSAADWTRLRRSEQAVACRLALRWLTDGPAHAAAVFGRYSREAAAWGISGPSWDGLVATEIARASPSPDTWLNELIHEEVPGLVLEPFIGRLISESHPDASTYIVRVMERPEWHAAVVANLLTIEPARPDLLSLVRDALEPLSELVFMLALQGRVPEEQAGWLLQHPSNPIRSSACLGLWESRADHSILEPLQVVWTEAFLECVDEDRSYAIRRIVDTDRDLAFQWLARRLERDDFDAFRFEDVLRSCGSSLAREQRLTLLERVTGGLFTDDLVNALVQRDPEILALILDRDPNSGIAGTVLSGKPDERWTALAITALDRGVPPGRIAEYAFGGVHSWSGSLADAWQEWVDGFTLLQRHRDPRVREIGALGRRKAERLRDRARQDDAREAIHGIE